MKVAVLAGMLAVSVATAPRAADAQPQTPAQVAEAYSQFLLGHHLDENNDEAGAIAAYKRAMQLDPTSAEIPGELAALYLRENKVQDAMNTAEQALKISPANREANRVLGVINAAMAEGRRGGNHATDAIRYLEQAIAGQGGEADPNVRATLSRLYVATGQYDKAIPILTTLVNEQPGWQDGPVLLAEAYSAAGRTEEAISWLEEQTADDPRLLPTLADFYERARRWKEAAETYDRALARAPRNSELRARYASALVNAGGRDNLTKARGILNDLIAARPSDSARILYLLSQTERRLGDSQAAEATARRVIAQNAQSPWGYYALAEALESRRDYQAVVDELAPVVASHAGKTPDGSFDVGLLLPHLGFAYQELGRTDQAIATFEQAAKLSPDDPAAASYLAEANIAAKRYDAALSVAKSALAGNPDDQRLIRLEAQALRYTGKPAEAAARLEQALEKHDDDPTAYIALAQMYTETERGADAVKLLEAARQKFPDDNSLLFEVGATFDRLKRFPEAEAAFKQLIARDPQNAAALNYLGYMLAERGERLDESVDYVKRALEIDPDNGSFLDSLGWAYYKAEKLDLAEGSLRRAADQMKTNSVIQDHYGDVLLKLGRYADAIAAFNRALSGDGDSIDRADIGKKIQAARQKLKK